MSTTRPTCVCCKRPLSKYSRHLSFNVLRDGQPLPATKEEARARTNLTVISYSRGAGGKIWGVGTWDETSWGDGGAGFFCTGSCARAYGYACATMIRDKKLVCVGR